MNMPNLNLPNVELKIKLVGDTMQVFDNVRKKYFNLTSEEWVRQHFIHYLHNVKNYPFGLMRVEKMLKYNNMKNRADIVLYNIYGNPIMIVECKSPEIKMNQESFNQVAKYNCNLRVDFLVVTNGMQHFCCKMDYKNNNISFLNDIPDYLGI